MQKLYCLPLGESMRESFVKEAEQYPYGEAVFVVPGRFLGQEVKKLGNVRTAIIDYLPNEILRHNNYAGKFIRISRPAQEMLIQNIMEELVAAGKIKYFAPLIDKKGFGRNVVALISELARGNVSATKLMDAFSAWGRSGPQAEKDKEISLIYTTYTERLKQFDFYDIDGLYRLALAVLSLDNVVLPWKKLYFSEFYQFNELQLSLIKALSKHIDISIGLFYDTTKPALAKATEFAYSDLLNLGFTKEPVTVKTKRSSDLTDLITSWKTPNSCSLPPSNISILEGYTVEQEMALVVSSIKELLTKGAKATDIICLVRNMDEYNGLSNMFAEYGVPTNLPSVTNFLGQQLPDFFQRLLTTALMPHEVDYWKNLLAHPLAGKLYGIDGQALEESYNRYFYDSPKSLMAYLEGTGKTKIGELEELVKKLGTKQTAEELKKLGLKTLEDWKLLKTWGEEFREDKISLEEMKILAATIQQLQGILESFALTMEQCGQRSVATSIGTLLDFWQESAQGLTLTVEKGNPFGVKVMEVTNVQGVNFPYVYIMGLREDVFPHIKQENWLYTDKERIELTTLGVPLRTSPVALDQEQYFFASALSMATSGLFLSYYTDDAKGASAYMEELKNYYSKDSLEVRKWAESIDTCASERKLLNLLAKEPALDETATKWAEERWGKDLKEKAALDVTRWEEDCPYNGKIEPQVLAKSYSASALNNFIKCPFRYMGQYIWNLEAWEPVGEEATPIAIGNIYHNVLATFVGRHLQEKLTDYAEKDLLIEINKDFEAAYANAVASGDIIASPYAEYDRKNILRHLKKWLETEISYQANATKYNLLPYAVEKPYGQEAKDSWPMLELEIGEDKVHFQGRIDRIDTDGTNYIVTDYKTGSIPTNTEIKAGTELQLPLYCLALEKCGNIARDNIIGASYYLLNDPHRDGGAWLPEVKGNVPWMSKQKRQPALEEVLSAVEASLARSITGIKKGSFPVDPLSKGSCEYCSFKDACRQGRKPKKETDEERNVVELNIEAVEEEEVETAAKPLAPTAEQKAAIETLDKNVSVSAGAGSGKTRVLVERFLEIVRKEKANADQILAITFTKKAAKEMRERANDTLLKEVRKAEGDKRKYWQEQVNLLARAQITTIDSLCNKIVKENPIEAEMDPSFTIREEFEMDDFKGQIIEEFLKTSLQAGQSDLLGLVDVYGPSRTKDFLQQLIYRMDDVLAFGDLAAPYRESVAKLGGYKKDLRLAFVQLLSVSNQVTGGVTIECFNNMIVLKDRLLQAIDDEDFDSLASASKKITCNKKTNTIISEEYGSFKAALSKCYGALRDETAIEVTEHIQKVLENFKAYYHEAQAKLEYYDFSFISAKALELLENKPNVLAKYREKYKYIMVDEFQDTDDNQKKMVYLLAGGTSKELKGNRLFIVGDGKQSIYRFRGADVSVFKAVRDDIEKTHGENIVMADNFRSTPQIIAMCNCLFRDLLGTDANSDVAAQDLKPNHTPGPVPQVRVIKGFAQNDTDALAAESRWVANTIKGLVEKNKKRKYSDVAILVPVISLGLKYQEELTKLGIASNITDGRGFYEKQEIVDCANLFQFCLNPRKDVPLLGLLRSPYLALDDATLSTLLVKRGEATLWESLEKAAKEKAATVKVKACYEKLQNLILTAGNLSLVEFWQTFMTSFKVENLLLSEDRGAEKLANVEKLGGMIIDSAAKEGGTLQSFADRLQQVREANAREASAPVADTDDAVKIMTIHKSKGLQFKVVFLPSLIRRERNDTEIFRFTPKLGLGIKVYDEEGNETVTSIFEDVKAEIKEQEAAEKTRQLYVAMTRAEEELYLSTMDWDRKSSDKEDASEKWFQSLNRVFHISANESLVDWDEIPKDEVEWLSAVEKNIKETSIPKDTLERIKPIAGTDSLKQQAFSASSLQEYDMCPRRFFYNHVMGMPGVEENIGTGTSIISPQVLGLIVHRTMELKHELSLEDALARAIIEAELEGSTKTAYETTAKKMLEAYCASPLYKEIENIPQDAEKDFTIELLNLPEGKVTFTGSIDCLLYYPDGTLGIIDFKTGHPPVNDEEKTGYTRQLIIYALAAEKIFKKKVSKAELHFLQNNTAWTMPSDRSLKEAELTKLMTELLAKKDEEDFTVLPANCKYCSYSYFCKKV